MFNELLYKLSSILRTHLRGENRIVYALQLQKITYTIHAYFSYKLHNELLYYIYNKWLLPLLKQ